MNVSLKFQKVALSLAALSMLANPAWAGFAQGNSVTLGGQPAFTIAGADHGFSPEHRAWITQDRLDNALVLSADKSPNAVNVERRNGAIVVTVGGREVATADDESARIEGISPDALADRWANSIRRFLADQPTALGYIASLTNDHPVSSQVALVERRLYAAAGTALPVVFSTAINSETIKAGDSIEGLLVEDVALGSYAIPKGAAVIGVVNEMTPGAFTVSFTNLRTPAGTIVPITATLASPLVPASAGPRYVATLSMPAGQESECRAPATIAIGGLGGPGQDTLVLRRGSNMCISAGTPMTLVFDQVTPVAVVMRGPLM